MYDQKLFQISYQEDHQSGTDTNGEAHDIDEGESFVPCKVPDS